MSRLDTHYTRHKNKNQLVLEIGYFKYLKEKITGKIVFKTSTVGNESE